MRPRAEQGPHQRLGDARSTAVTWGQIADIAYDRGELDEAARLHLMRLRAFEELGDLDGIAAAKWSLGRVDLARQDHQSALPRLVEAFQALHQLQRADGIAVVGRVLGELLLAAEQPGQARQVLEASLVAATKIGATDLAQQTRQLLARCSEEPDQQ